MRFLVRSMALALMGVPLFFAALAQVPELPAEEPVGVAEVPVTADAADVAPRLTAADVSAWLDGFMPFTLERGDVAGAVVVVVRDGEVLAQRGYGYADVEARTPVDPATTLFRPGSVSKLITWTALMQLVEQGKVDLDADVNRYLDFQVPASGEPITVRQVLTHTPGLAERVKGLMSVGPGGPVPLGEYLKAWVPKQIHAPGTTPAYSNYATALAGYIVERVSGMSFDDYLDRHVFAPLGMDHSTFRQPLPERLQPLMSKGYRLGSGDPMPFEVVPAAPAGSMSASGADMAKFMIAHLQGAAGEDSPILSAQTAGIMHTAQTNFTPPLNTMALGFYETSVNGHRVLAHGGDTQWFHTYLYLFEDSGLGLYVSMNSAGIDGVTGPIRADLLQQFADRYLPDERPRPAGEVDPDTAREHARMMASHTYWSSRRAASGFVQLMDLQQVSFSINDDGTISSAALRGTNGQPIRWREVAPLLWHEVGGTERLAAVVEDGRLSHWAIESMAPIMLFQPVPGYRSSSWLLPLFGLSLLAMVLAAVRWPAAALVRRRYGARLQFAGRQLQVYRLSRWAIVGTAVVWLGWIIVCAYTMSDFSRFAPALDKWLVLLGLATWVTGLGGIGLLAWHAWHQWTGGRGWWPRITSALMLLAALVLFYVAMLHGLLTFATEY